MDNRQFEKINSNTVPANGEMLDFTVMPKDLTQSRKPEELPSDSSGTGGGKFWKIFLIVLAVVIALGAAGYFVYLKYITDQPSEESPSQSQIEVPIAPQVEMDSDGDGLTDKIEGERGTDPQKPDTDSDGLADSDELNVYGSDPLLLDSDNDGFDDGREVARGFSPISNSTDKAGADELGKWGAAIANFGLHNPTPQTLKLKADISSQQRVIYNNVTYKYSLDLPAVLTFREADEGRGVGFYVAGTVPADSDWTSDPIAARIAVKVENQDLKTWVDSQYSKGRDYKNFQNITVNTNQAIELSGMAGRSCESTRTFFAKEGIVIILILNCADQPEFLNLYNEVVQSFKFL